MLACQGLCRYRRLGTLTLKLTGHGQSPVLATATTWTFTRNVSAALTPP